MSYSSHLSCPSIPLQEAPFVPDMSAFDPLNSLCEQDAQVLHAGLAQFRHLLPHGLLSAHTSVLLPLFKRAQVLQDLGFNFMRVYVAWQGVMPSLGAINTTYLDQVEQVPVYKLKPLLNLHTIPLAP